MAEQKKAAQKGDARDKPETPSAIANAKVGADDSMSDEELAEVAARWNAEKRRAQRGF